MIHTSQPYDGSEWSATIKGYLFLPYGLFEVTLRGFTGAEGYIWAGERNGRRIRSKMRRKEGEEKGRQGDMGPVRPGERNGRGMPDGGGAEVKLFIKSGINAFMQIGLLAEIKVKK